MLQKQKFILEKVKHVVEHQKQLSKSKGELFNIYDILNLKTKEVRTHSAFIAELLNPKGSHLMENVFLEAFIKLFEEKEFFNDMPFDTKSPTVSTEYFIGRIDNKKKTGGNIDIIITDVNGHTIAIENKIDAYDQDTQIERYSKYNNGKNKVIYLSKFGTEPSIESKGELASDQDFFIISYQKDIVNWLENCQALAYDQPILRESIKQYRILIQKITNTLENKQDKELKSVVLKNIEEASLIASKYNQVARSLRNDFRNKILDLLKQEIKGYSISKRRNISQLYASIWFNSEKSDPKKAWFGVEPFSGKGHLDGDLFVGINNTKKSLNLGNEYVPLKGEWVHHKVLLYDGVKINTSDSAFLKKISTNDDLEIVALHVVKQIASFIEEHRSMMER